MELLQKLFESSCLLFTRMIKRQTCLQATRAEAEEMESSTRYLIGGTVQLWYSVSYLS